MKIKFLLLTSCSVILVQACAGLTRTNTAPPTTYVREALILEPQNEDMLVDPKALDLSEIPDDITFPQSVDLNKICIVSHKNLETAKRDWIAFYGYLLQLNPKKTETPVTGGKSSQISD